MQLQDFHIDSHTLTMLGGLQDFYTDSPPAVSHTITSTAMAFSMNSSFDECVLQEINSGCAETT